MGLWFGNYYLLGGGLRGNTRYFRGRGYCLHDLKGPHTLGGKFQANDSVIFLTFTEDRKEICKMEEVVDTAFYEAFFPRF